MPFFTAAAVFTTDFLLQVLVEYDDVEWHRREWISVYKEGLFHLFMVEQGLYWAERTDPFTSSHSTVLWPALVSTYLLVVVRKIYVYNGTMLAEGNTKSVKASNEEFSLSRFFLKCTPVVLPRRLELDDQRHVSSAL